MDIVAIGSHLPVNLRVVALAGASRQAARNKVLAVKQVLRMSVTLRKGLRKVFGKLLSVIGPWHPWPWKGRVQIGCGSVVISSALSAVLFLSNHNIALLYQGWEGVRLSNSHRRCRHFFISYMNNETTK